MVRRVEIWSRRYGRETHNSMGMGRRDLPGCDRNCGSDPPHSCSFLAGAGWWEISAGRGDGFWVRTAPCVNDGAYHPGRRFYDSCAATIRAGYSRETLIVSSLVGEIVVCLRAGDWNLGAGDELHHEYWGSE